MANAKTWTQIISRVTMHFFNYSDSEYGYFAALPCIKQEHRNAFFGDSFRQSSRQIYPRFSSNTIGLKGSNDRQVIPLLRNLKFLDQSGSPTANYRLLKSRDTAKHAVADGIRSAYAPLFAANEDAHSLTSEKLRGLVAQVAGTDDDMTGRIVSTLSSLIKQGDFSNRSTPPSSKKREDDQPEDSSDEQVGTSWKNGLAKPMRPEFHYNIQVHLPNNGSEEVYLNIFNALRKSFA
ncbi:hypothetical protein M2282_002828 [Variovorax boronicumulans]|uniref:DUF5343 domain-containing protein n=1 Tax=Variovorax boronicumulans TaxID=436515 RepID=UPI002473922B|nr:DUF5343 domain-containing protein [Variovorax boronicumulans]MDH6167678.1 hypothetical protein [Variovorax boronicumulans]